MEYSPYAWESKNGWEIDSKMANQSDIDIFGTCLPDNEKIYTEKNGRKSAKDILGTEDVSKAQIDILKNLFLSYSNDEEYFKNLFSIAKQFGIPEYDLYNYVKEYVIGASSGAQDLQKQILDNYAKVLKGELT